MSGATEAIQRLRAAQDMVRLLLGNSEAAEADLVVAGYVVDKTGQAR